MIALMLVWGTVLLVFGAVSVMRRSLLPLPAAFAAVFAMVALLLGTGVVASCFVFVVVFAIGRWALRPIERAEAEQEPRVRPGLGTIVGMPAIVVERVANEEALGCVRVADELWSARTPEGEPPIEVGARVHVVEMRGSTAIVSD